jgi:hypothetical protein
MDEERAKGRRQRAEGRKTTKKASFCKKPLLYLKAYSPFRGSGG